MGYCENVVRSYEEAVALADTQGKKVVPADNFTLQIDIDSEEDFRRWKNASDLLKVINPESVNIISSSGGFPHRHITVNLGTYMDVWKRIALQVLLGSDFVREKMNAYRVLKGDMECPIAFFEETARLSLRMIRPERKDEAD